MAKAELKFKQGCQNPNIEISPDNQLEGFALREIVAQAMKSKGRVTIQEVIYQSNELKSFEICIVPG